MNTKTYQHADSILQHMPVGVALFDACDLRLLAANALYHTFHDMYLDPRWQHGQAIGHPITDWLPEAEPTETVAIMRRVAETGIPYKAGEYIFPILGHGTTYWNWTVNPVRDGDDGPIRQLLLTISEVTAQILARRQAEQAQTSLSQSNRAIEIERKKLEVIETVIRSARESLDLESIGQSATNAICTHFNATGVCIHIDDPVRQELRMLSIPTPPDTEQVLRLIHHVPYDSPFLVAQARNRRDPIIIEDLPGAVASGTVANNHPFTSHTFPHSLHSYICVPLWFKDHFEGTLTALFRERIQLDGPEVKTLQGCGTHLAAALAHARLHTDIENERVRLRTVIDRLPEGILLVEAASGFINYVNAAAADILGVPLMSLVGVRFDRYPQAYAVKDRDDQSIPPWSFVVIRALCGEVVSSQEILVTRPNGSNVMLLCSTAPLRGEHGMIAGAVTVFQDITTHRSIEQQKNEFLAIASHELRTPITAIQGFAEILQMMIVRGQSLDGSRSLRTITGISEQSERLTRLIEEMLDISRIEHAQLLLDLAPHDLLTTLTHVVESQAIIARQHSLRLVLEGFQSNDTLIGYFDRDRIEQVLYNLINNAIKYSPAGGEIEVGLRRDGVHSHEALMWVRDQGIGIAANECSHVFERFHRASNLDRSISGLGIGLYLAKELVERHGGRIWVESTEGIGSTFSVALPLGKREG